MTMEVVEAFDKCMYVCIKIDPCKLIMNKSSYNRALNKLRKLKSEKIKLLFKAEGLVYFTVHWDGKFNPVSVTSKRFHRLPILVTCKYFEKIMPPLEHGTGMATVVCADITN